jgi:DNA-binding transcriptional regulator YdaS (Cro superfamily)
MAMKTKMQVAIDILGGPSKTSRLLGVTSQAVCFWRDGDRRFPAELCPVVERLTSGVVRCEDLRPDVDWAYLRGSVDREAA